MEKVHIQLCINLPTHSRRGVSAGGRNEKYALTYSFSLEDDLQVENQRERERETLTPRMGEYRIAEYLYIFTLIRGGSGSFC